MTEARHGGGWERRKPMAATTSFFREKLRRSKHHSEDMMLATIYALYRKWSFLRDESPYSKENFERDLRRALKVEPEEFRGGLLFPCYVRETEVESAPVERRLQPKETAIMGQVKVLHNVTFADTTIPRGATVDWLEPNEKERADMKDRRKATSLRDEYFLVIMFAGMRRIIAAHLVERML